MDKIRVVLADDHQMLREGLCALLAKEPDIEVVGQAVDGAIVLELVEKLNPDVVVMDIVMPGLNGLEATRRLARKHPGTKVVVLSTYTDKRSVLQMLQAGACAYVVKGASSEELLRALRAARAGQRYVSPEVVGFVVDGPRPAPGPEAGAEAAVLGTREREVLQLLAEGLTSLQIGTRLDISAKTVETHRRNIMIKLNMHSVAELTKYAVRQGLTSLEH
jgi:two-component system NarL family response regulator